MITFPFFFLPFYRQEHYIIIIALFSCGDARSIRSSLLQYLADLQSQGIHDHYSLLL